MSKPFSLVGQQLKRQIFSTKDIGRLANNESAREQIISVIRSLPYTIISQLKSNRENFLLVHHYEAYLNKTDLALNQLTVIEAQDRIQYRQGLLISEQITNKENQIEFLSEYKKCIKALLFIFLLFSIPYLFGALQDFHNLLFLTNSPKTGILISLCPFIRPGNLQDIYIIIRSVPMNNPDELSKQNQKELVILLKNQIKWAKIQIRLIYIFSWILVLIRPKLHQKYSIVQMIIILIGIYFIILWTILGAGYICCTCIRSYCKQRNQIYQLVDVISVLKKEINEKEVSLRATKY